MRKKGISMIVLIITIIVMSVLVTAVMRSMDNNNPVADVKESKLKLDVSTLKEEYHDYTLHQAFSNATAIEGFDEDLLNVYTDGKMIYDGEETVGSDFEQIIPSLNKSIFKDNVFIASGQMYIYNKDNFLSDAQVEWIEEEGVQVVDNGKVVISVNKKKFRIPLGVTDDTLKIITLPDSTKADECNLLSKDEDIISINESKHLYANAEGETEVTINCDVAIEPVICKVTVGKNIPAPVSGITISPTSISLNKGEIYRLIATVSPSNAIDKEVTWSSSDESIATVDEYGLVTAVANGNAIITATSNSDSTKTATCQVTVKNHITSITLNKTELSLKKGQNETLLATVIPSEETSNISWSSSDESIATVNQDGLVKAVGVGRTTITVKSKDNDVSATCKITVLEPLEFDASISEINSDSIKLSINASTTYSVIENISLEVQKEGVGVVKLSSQIVNYTSYSNDNYMISDLESNTTYNIKLVAILKDGTSKTVNLTATTPKVEVSSLTLDKTNIVLFTDGTNTDTLTASILPDNATDKKIIWSSSDTNVAIVNDDGLVTAISTGSATIKATSNSDNTKKATCDVIVDPVAYIGDKYYLTLQSAFDAVDTTPASSLTDTITLLKNVSLDENATFASGKSAILSLNYFEISLNSNSIINEGTLIINDGSIKSNDIALINKGTLTINTTDISSNSTVEPTISNTNILSMNTSSITSESIAINEYYDTKEVQLNLSNINITASMYAIEACGTTNINSGTLIGEGAGIYLSGSSGIEQNVNIVSGTIIGGNEAVADTYANCGIWIEDNVYGIIPQITLGTNDSNVSVDLPNVTGIKNGFASNSGIKGNIYFYDGIVVSKQGNDPIVSDYEVIPLSGYELLDTTESDGSRNVKLRKDAVARIDTVYYETLQAAFADVNGSTDSTEKEIEILKDIILDEDLTIDNGKKVILNTSSYTISGKKDSGNYLIENNGELKITGNGIIQNENYATIGNVGTLTVESGSITSNSLIDSTIYNTGIIYINGGILEHPNTTSTSSVIYNSSTDAKIITEGGWIKGYYYGLTNFGIAEINSGSTINTTGDSYTIEDGDYIPAAICHSDYSGGTPVLTINGGTIESAYCGLLTEGTCQVNMNGGLIEGGYAGVMLNGSFNMTGGTVSYYSGWAAIGTYSNSSVNITGGTIFNTGDTSNSEYSISTNDSENVIITLGENEGGTPSTTVPEINGTIELNDDTLNFYDGIIIGNDIDGPIYGDGIINTPTSYRVQVTDNTATLVLYDSLANYEIIPGETYISYQPVSGDGIDITSSDSGYTNVQSFAAYNEDGQVPLNGYLNCIVLHDTEDGYNIVPTYINKQLTLAGSRGALFAEDIFDFIGKEVWAYNNERPSSILTSATQFEKFRELYVQDKVTLDFSESFKYCWNDETVEDAWRNYLGDIYDFMDIEIEIAHDTTPYLSQRTWVINDNYCMFWAQDYCDGSYKDESGYIEYWMQYCNFNMDISASNGISFSNSYVWEILTTKDFTRFNV